MRWREIVQYSIICPVDRPAHRRVIRTSFVDDDRFGCLHIFLTPSAISDAARITLSTSYSCVPDRLKQVINLSLRYEATCPSYFSITAPQHCLYARIRSDNAPGSSFCESRRKPTGSQYKTMR